MILRTVTQSRLPRRHVLCGLATAGAALALPAIARAQAAWPSQAIKLVVPFAPGGSTDLLARVLGRKLEPILNQPIIVENRPGAGGSIAATAVAKSDPDGYTLMMGHIGTLALNPSIYPALGYDPVVDFAPVALVASVPNILVVHPDVPANSVAELIAYAKANPGKLNFGSGGNGSNSHISGYYLAHKAGIKVTHVAYRGTGPAVNDLVGGHVQFMMTGGPSVLPLVAGGKLRALAVSSLTRVAFAPDLPAIAEATLPGFEAVQWYGLVAPAKTPSAIVMRLNREINALLDSPEVAKNLETDGALAIRTTPDAFAAHIKSEIILWRDVIKAANITAG